jgi:hypothetical protein
MAGANSTITTGNHSLDTINELALAIEALADIVPNEPLHSTSESLPLFVSEGLLVGIQHLAQKINQLSAGLESGPKSEEV